MVRYFDRSYKHEARVVDDSLRGSLLWFLTIRLLATREKRVESKRCAQAQGADGRRRSIPANQLATHPLAGIVPAPACKQPVLEGRSRPIVRLKRPYCIQNH